MYIKCQCGKHVYLNDEWAGLVIRDGAIEYIECPNCKAQIFVSFVITIE